MVDGKGEKKFLPPRRSVEGYTECEAAGVWRGIGEVDESLGAGAGRNRLEREGKSLDLAEVAIPAPVDPQLETEDGWLRAAGFDPYRRNDGRGVRTSEEEAYDLLGSEGMAYPTVIIGQGDFGDAKGRIAAPSVRDPDEERQEVPRESPWTMMPGLGLDGRINLRQTCADCLSGSIRLGSRVGQGVKAHAPTGLEQQHQDQ
jgi:hypothetical protein